MCTHEYFPVSCTVLSISATWDWNVVSAIHICIYIPETLTKRLRLAWQATTNVNIVAVIWHRPSTALDHGCAFVIGDRRVGSRAWQRSMRSRKGGTTCYEERRASSSPARDGIPRVTLPEVSRRRTTRLGPYQISKLIVWGLSGSEGFVTMLMPCWRTDGRREILCKRLLLVNLLKVSRDDPEFNGSFDEQGTNEPQTGRSELAAAPHLLSEGPLVIAWAQLP
ncbi:hypothetical protein F4860DRAFT_348679 [Xylaria cubensis]|nr:hypothetical protein F4860DRAFT_348679 [Xylaria cubensis]